MIQKAIDRTPALTKHMTGAPDETVGHQLGTIAKLIIWLVGIMAALQFLGFAQILAPINELVNEIFAFLPQLIGAGLIFFVGLIVARIVRRLVETVLIAANVDGLLARIGIGSTEGTVRTAADAVPPGDAPGATRASLASAAGVLVYALIIIPVAIAALQVLGIEAISGPAIAMLNEILAAIPRVLAAALWIGIAFIAARFLKTIIEAILPPTGFDDAIRSTGVLPGDRLPVADRRQHRDGRDHPRRLDRGGQAARRRNHRHLPRAGDRAWRQGDLRHADHRRRDLPRPDHRQPGRQRHGRRRLCADASSAMRSSPCSPRSA